MAGSQHSNTFKPYSALGDEAAKYPGAAFAEIAFDVAVGLDTALALLEDSTLAENAGDTPFLNPSQRSDLLRLAIATNRLLERSAWKQVEWLNEHGAQWVRGGAFEMRHLRPREAAAA